MIKELYIRYPKILFIYKIMRAIFASWGFVWFCLGIISLFNQGLSIAQQQTLTLLWCAVGFTSLMGVYLFIKISLYKPQATPVIGDIAKYHHLDEPTGNVSYMNPVEDLENLKKNGEGRGFKYWGERLNELKKKHYKGDSYNIHRNYCMKMLNETRNIIEF